MVGSPRPTIFTSPSSVPFGSTFPRRETAVVTSNVGLSRSMAAAVVKSFIFVALSAKLGWRRVPRMRNRAIASARGRRRIIDAENTFPGAPSCKLSTTLSQLLPPLGEGEPDALAQHGRAAPAQQLDDLVV